MAGKRSPGKSKKLKLTRTTLKDLDIKSGEALKGGSRSQVVTTGCATFTCKC